jgi:hypothetical protein
MTIINKKICREIICKLNLDNAGYPSVQNILSSHPLFKNVQIIMCESIIYQLLSIGVKLGLSTTEKHSLRVLKSRVIRRCLDKTA